MSKTIAVLGCGWLGLPLAKQLHLDGYIVKGSTTRKTRLQELCNVGIEAFEVHLKPEVIKGNITLFLKHVDILIVAFPPKLKTTSTIQLDAIITHLAEAINAASVGHIIYISSTAVFEDDIAVNNTFRSITEDTPPDGTSKRATQLIRAESILKRKLLGHLTILRFGGLIGKSRHPITYLAGQRHIKNPEAPVNLIHLEDCIALIQFYIKANICLNVLIGVNPTCKTKKQYYQDIATQLGLPLPEFDTKNVSKGKSIYPKHLLNDLKFTFSKPV